jgi:hypothetical protein
MATNLTKYKDDLSKLVHLGNRMYADLEIRSFEKGRKLTKELSDLKKEVEGSFEKNYHRWYSEAQVVIRQLLPNREEEFESLYRTDPKRKSVNAATYSIQDWLLGMRASKNQFTGEKYFDDILTIINRFKNQLDILQSAEARFETSLFDIQQLVQADLFDSELDKARMLVKNGFLRAAGVIAGVVLERHQSQICNTRNISVAKKQPTINDYNDLLKGNNVVDIPTWRFLQRLADLRNLCSHNKDREPTKEEVVELVDGVERTIKTIF